MPIRYEMCSCGHLGGQNCEGEHEANFQEGHGKCTLCECQQFTWVGYYNSDGRDMTLYWVMVNPTEGD